MKSTLLLLIGITIGALGSGSYIATSQRVANPPDSNTQVRQGSPSGSARPEVPRKLRPLWNPNRGTNSKGIDEKEAPKDSELAEVNPTSKNESAKVRTRLLISNSPRTLSDTNPGSQEELIELAAQIEKRAHRELDRLSSLLDLSEQQQDRIFPLLVRSSTTFQPSLGIRIGEAETSNVTNLPEAENSSSNERSSRKKSTVPTEPSEPTEPTEENEPLLANEADQEIHDLLSEEQQQALEDALVDEDLWWTDIVGDLEDELDESTVVTTEEDTSYEGNTGIGSLLQQAAETASTD